MKNKMVALTAVLVLSIGVAGAVFAQDDEAKLGVELRTQLGFGNIAGKDYRFIGDGKVSDYKPGQAVWVLPSITVNASKGNLSFTGHVELQIKDDTDPKNGEKLASWNLHNVFAKFNNAFSDSLNAWITFGDDTDSDGSTIFKPGVSFKVAEVVTLQLQVPFRGNSAGWFDGLYYGNLLQPNIALAPGVGYAANGLSIFAEPTLQLLNGSSYAEPDGQDSDGWNKYKAADKNNNFLDGLYLCVNYTTGALFLQVDSWIPLHKVEDGKVNDKGEASDASGIEQSGLSITPLVEFAVKDNLKIYAKATIGNIGKNKEVLGNDEEGAKVSISPAIGIKLAL